MNYLSSTEQTFQMNDRLVVVDGEQMCWCAREQKYHPCIEFSINKKSWTGFNYTCKNCVQEKLTSVQISPNEDGYDEAIGVLKRLGYDLNSEIPVHQQFKMKHNL